MFDPMLQSLEIFFTLAAAGLFCWYSLFLPGGWR